MNVTLECKATGVGTVKYSWQRKDTGNWTTISTSNITSYAATTSGVYRCMVNNEAGSVVSNNATVNVYGEYCPNM